MKIDESVEGHFEKFNEVLEIVGRKCVRDGACVIRIVY